MEVVNQEQSYEIYRKLLGGSLQAIALTPSPSLGGSSGFNTAAVCSRLAERYLSATVNRMLSALRSVLKTAWKLGQMSAEDYHRAADVGSVKGETLPAGRSISSGELSALMDACTTDHSPAGARDAAIVALLYSCGLRRAKLVALDFEDYDALEGTLIVRGKRNK